MYDLYALYHLPIFFLSMQILSFSHFILCKVFYDIFYVVKRIEHDSSGKCSLEN